MRARLLTRMRGGREAEDQERGRSKNMRKKKEMGQWKTRVDEGDKARETGDQREHVWLRDTQRQTGMAHMRHSCMPLEDGNPAKG